MEPKRRRTLRAGIVVEAANGPITSKADAYLAGKGVEILPHIHANAGGSRLFFARPIGLDGCRARIVALAVNFPPPSPERQ